MNLEKDCYEKKKFHFDIDYFDEPRVFGPISLLQIGDISCNRDFIIKSHEQQCYEISYIVSGKGSININGNKYNVKKGEIYINLPQEKHSGEADQDNPFRYLYMGFIFNRHPYEENLFSHIQKMFHKIEMPVLLDRMDIQVPFLQAINEIYTTSEFSELMIKAFIQEIIIKTYRNFCSNWEYQYAPNQKLDGNKSIIRNIINYIDSNILDIVELKQVSKTMGYSYSYLSHVFSEETGITIQAYYVQKKIEKAADLLNKREINIAQIAEKLQYQSIHSFGKAFKKTMGISPAKYQQIKELKKSKE